MEGLGRSAARPHWLCRGGPEGGGDDPEQGGVGTRGSEGDPDAGGGLDDACGDFEEPQAQGRELSVGKRGCLGDGLLDAPHQPECGGVQDQPHLIGVG